MNYRKHVKLILLVDDSPTIVHAAYDELDEREQRVVIRIATGELNDQSIVGLARDIVER